MAADTLVTGSKLTAIANAIRTKGGTSSPLTLDQMPQAVADLPSGGGGGGGLAKSFLALAGRNTQQAYDMTDPEVAIDIVSSDWGESDGTHTAIRAYAFYPGNSQPLSGYNARVRSIHVPEWITYVGTNAFDNVKNLQSVTFDGTFDASGGVLHGHVENGSESMFGYCSEMTSVDFGDRKLDLQYGSSGTYKILDNCKSIVNVEIPIASGGTIPMYFINSCVNLQTVVLKSASLSAIATWSFYGLSSLQNLVLDIGSNIPSLSSTTAFRNTPTPEIYVPDASYAQYETATNWSALWDHIHKLSDYNGWRQS